ncbi:hypothetical protein PR202_gb20998 [Eleusine coracana subsp. coracana]|uniref:Uncharacterized protein n=1 Tax=Eleusine coracana subsp. coracana TaxID=191504 RepID=A0AAV5FA07_ELECO|nr:hypothetical protein PR202_gb20998 [Eleusine coracana subsp. coracana]
MVRQLANDPAMVQDHEEIARNKGDSDALTWEDLAKMKFTWRVALETFFGNFRRAMQDIDYDGYRIPVGWHVFWVSNVTHMDPTIFHEPTKFDASRFENQSLAAVPPCSFVAFGSGQRICAGMEFARIERDTSDDAPGQGVQMEVLLHL